MEPFNNYVNGQRAPGSDGTGETRYFMSYSHLEDYWADYKIRQVISGAKSPVPPGVIKSRYLRVFSTLVYINRVHDLDFFVRVELHDDQFPASKIPNKWEIISPAHEELWKVFCPAHWMFFPLELSRDRLIGSRIPPERILPWKSQQEIAIGDGTQISRIEVPNSCFPDDESSPQFPHRSFVLKRYDETYDRNFYENERDALTELHGRTESPAHVIKFHGSFEQHNTMNLLLEYVDGGHLLDYWERHPPPKTTEDVHALWTSIVGILIGCYHIHQWTQHHERGQRFRIVHQDLKPENILIQQTTSPSSGYVFHAKVADFGCSHVRDGREEYSPDRNGNPKYSAPECSRVNQSLQRGPDIITPKADIFALGCILSEVAAWVAGGTHMIDTYREMRNEEIERYPEFSRSGHHESFHNGAAILDAVRSMRYLIGNMIPNDTVTLQILEVVYDHMLVANAKDRLSARELVSKFQRITEASKDTQGAWKTLGDVPRSSPSAIPRSPASPNPVDSPTIHNSREANGTNMPTPTSSQHVPHTSGTSDGVASTISATPTGQPSSGFRLRNPPVRNFSISSRTLTNNSGEVQPRVLSRTPTRRGIFGRFGNRYSALFQDTSPPNIRPSGPRLSGLPSSADGRLTINEILEYRRARKTHQPPNPDVQFLVTKLQRNLGRRDHIFFVDDTPTMDDRRTEVVRAFKALSYLAKQIDSDGIELVFASDPRRRLRSSSTRSLVQELNQHVFVQESGMMEHKLSDLLQHTVEPRLPHHGRRLRRLRSALSKDKEMSILILTDGCWGGDLPDAAGVKEPIANLMREIEAKGLDRNQVMIQFIRFGDNENGKRHLELLDDFGQETGRDMVDTRSVNGNVYAMFIGSIAAGVDQQEDTS